MAQEAENTGKGKAGGSTGRLILSVVLMLPVVAVLMPSCIVLAVDMAPTVVAYVVDRTREKYLAITVGLLNLCGTAPAEVALWEDGQSYNAAFSTASDPLYLLMAYGAAAVGWAVYLMMPPILTQYFTITSHARLQMHLRKQQVLIDAWGDEVTGETAKTSSE